VQSSPVAPACLPMPRKGGTWGITRNAEARRRRAAAARMSAPFYAEGAVTSVSYQEAPPSRLPRRRLSRSALAFYVVERSSSAQRNGA